MRLPDAGRSVPTPLKNAALTAADLVGWAGRRSRALPDFLIAGAQRCGTTSLYKALTQHPQVLGPTLRKGVHYFDTSYGRGTDWYRSRFPLLRTVRAAAGGAGGIVGESSPYYLFHPLCAERIAADLPEAKVVVMLRDPVERAYSAHSHETARGYESEPFERALDLEEERLAGEEERLAADPLAHSHHHQHHAYAARGRYIDQLLRLERHVGRERMLVIDSERFFASPELHFPELEAFLGVRHCPAVLFGRHNARPRAELPDRLRRRLEEAYAESDERLAEWWGRTPSWRSSRDGTARHAAAGPTPAAQARPAGDPKDAPANGAEDGANDGPAGDSLGGPADGSAFADGSAPADRSPDGHELVNAPHTGGTVPAGSSTAQSAPGDGRTAGGTDAHRPTCRDEPLPSDHSTAEHQPTDERHTADTASASASAAAHGSADDSASGAPRAPDRYVSDPN